MPQQNWSAVAHLAMGVTTIHDPSNSAAEIFPAASYQRVGKYLAPRIFSTASESVSPSTASPSSSVT